MDNNKVKLHSFEVRPLGGKEESHVLKPHPWLSSKSWLSATLVAIALVMLHAVPTSGQANPTPTPTPNPCPTALLGQKLIPVPEIAAVGNKLRGTLVLSDEQEWMAFRVPVSAPSNQSRSQCQPQYVRIFREYGATPDMAPAPYGQYSKTPLALPRPGPTLRARVGDLIQLTFLNQINPSDFPNSIDRGETGVGGGCDESTSGYPGGDKYPDCFHGSSTGNIHFHGTHTNPGSTADNVFIEVRPSPRVGNKPTVTQASVQKSFDAFFARCEIKLNQNVLKEWPTTWSDLPPDWTAEQQKLLNQYDTQLKKDYPTSGIRKLWPVDAAQIKQNAWPQYYIGAYPYCFRLPEYKETSWPPPAPTPMQMGGAGSAEMQEEANIGDQGEAGRTLIMGQSPGTHWYHAHKHGSTAINVANGMTGAFIIEGQYDDDLNKWYGADWTRTQSVMVINQLGVTPNLMRGSASQIDKGPDFSVNGQLKPVISMRPGEVQMWRIVNTSGRAGAFFVGPPKGFQWKQLAQDGVQFDDVNYQRHVNKSFLLAPGNRADLLVKAPNTPCSNPDDCNVIVKNEVDPQDLVGTKAASPLTLLSVSVSGNPVDPKSNNGNFIPNAPTFPLFLGDIADKDVQGTKRIVFGSTPPNPPGNPAMHTIDGKKFDGEVGAVVLLNQVEEWKIVNETYGPPISHPFHIHINPFQVVEVFSPNDTITVPDPKQPGKTIIVPQYIFDPNAQVSKKQCLLNPLGNPDDWKPCGPPPVNKDGIWWDVFPIPSGIKAKDAKNNPIIDPKTKQPVLVPGYFKMRSRFVDYSGFYVIHCHILAHEDRGMMTIVEVAPARTPYSHH